MSTLLAVSGDTVTGYHQTGTIPRTQIVSGSDQRLGSRQPMFFQSGRRGAQVTVEFVKVLTDQATALSERTILENMQGQGVTVTNSHGEIVEVFCHTMGVGVKAGAQKWLVSASMSCEAMPSTTVLPTTP